MLYSSVENPETVEMLDVTTVITDDDAKCSKIHVIPELGESLTLADIRNSVDSSKRCITVITEWPLEGYVYRYGNHGDYWEKIGETCGYA